VLRFLAETLEREEDLEGAEVLDRLDEAEGSTEEAEDLMEVVVDSTEKEGDLEKRNINTFYNKTKKHPIGCFFVCPPLHMSKVLIFTLSML